MDGLTEGIRGREDLVIFLDYDGTLSSIVPDPSAAFMTDRMRDILAKLCAKYPVAVVTGRKEATIRKFLQPLDENLILATSHGLEVFFPGDSEPFTVGSEFRAPLAIVRRQLEEACASGRLPRGVHVEDNLLSVSVHYRQIERESDISFVEDFVDALVRQPEVADKLRKATGKCVFEFRPNIDWHKGRAVEYVFERKFLRKPFPIYLGDDVTDEDAFAVVNALGGVTVQVGNHKHHTLAQHTLQSVEQVGDFLARLVTHS